MSVSLRHLKNPEKVVEVTSYYLSEAHPTVAATAAACGVSHHTAARMIRENVAPEVVKRRKSANYSRSKQGAKNPQHGLRYYRVNKIGNYLNVWVQENREYLQQLRRVMMGAVGLEKFPEGWHVHHIDGNPENNSPDNLALVNPVGHGKLHRQRLEKLKLWEKEEFGTSLLKRIIATLEAE